MNGYDVPAPISAGGYGYGDGAWWIIILLLFGYNRPFGGGNGVADGYALQTDFATLERKLDGVNAGLCDGFYAQNTNTLNGIAAIQSALCQGFSGVNQNIASEFRGLDNTINTLGYSLKDCCCQTQRAIDATNYNMATNFSNLNNTLCSLGRDIIENQNNNYRSIHEELISNKLEAKNERIAELQDALYKADLRASQATQSNYITDTILNKLSPCPSPAYIVPNPNCCSVNTIC